jgi:hypothetical protein
MTSHNGSMQAEHRESKGMLTRRHFWSDVQRSLCLLILTSNGTWTVLVNDEIFFIVSCPIHLCLVYSGECE